MIDMFCFVRAMKLDQLFALLEFLVTYGTVIILVNEESIAELLDRGQIVLSFVDRLLPLEWILMVSVE